MDDIAEDLISQLRYAAERIDTMRPVDEGDAEVINEAANEMERLLRWVARLRHECREQFERGAEMEASLWRDPAKLNAVVGSNGQGPSPASR